MSSQDWATWLEAFGTVGAFSVGFYEIISRNRQDRRDRQRSQASKISAWTFREGEAIVVSNKSGMPAYDTVVTFVVKDCDGRNSPKGQPGYRYTLRSLPPGDWQFPSPKGWRGMNVYPGVELAFTDASGRHWLRTSRGQLKTLKTVDPIKYYDIILPYISARLKPIDLAAQ